LSVELNAEMLGRSAQVARVVSLVEIESVVGAHQQTLAPVITRNSVGAERLSAGAVFMRPGWMSRPHIHERSEIVVMCLRGWAATLVGPDMTPHLHGPGEFAYIPPGVLHVGVNLSRRSSLLALEVRTDPTFHDDMVVVDDYEQAARAAVAALQDRAAAGELGLPSDWEDSDSTVRWQQWVNDGATAQW